MDFGSSHVYVGDSTATTGTTYYSSVPMEKSDLCSNNSEKADTDDPLYEAIGDLKLQSSVRKENIYGSLPNEQSSNKTAWDEIPNETAPPRPAKPAIYMSNASMSQDEDLSLAEQLRLALQERNKILKEKPATKKPPVAAKPQLLRKAPKPPIKPPRFKRNKNASKTETDIFQINLYDEVPSTEEKTDEYEDPDISLTNQYDEVPAEEETSTLAPDCLIDFESEPVLPSNTNNPFNEIELNKRTNSNGVFDILMPTVVNGRTDSVNGETDTSHFDASRLSDPLVNEHNVIPFPERISLVTNGTITTAVPNFYASEDLPSTNSQSATENLYPNLNLSNGNLLSDSCPKSPRLEPTAPVSSPVKSNNTPWQHQFSSNNISVPPSGQQDVKVPSLPLQPTAPTLSDSIERKKETAPTPSIQKLAQRDDTYTFADTNIVCVKLGIVGNNEASYFVSSVPSQCATCRGIRNNTDGGQKWECDFCQAINKSPVQSVPSSCAHDVTYLLQPPGNHTTAAESLIVFCIDISGSMCVSSKVNSGGNFHFVSRLKSLQQAINDQLNLIEATRPHCRVALVTFNDVVTLLGDGSPEQALTLNEYQLYDFDYLSHVGYVAPMPNKITATRLQLSKAVQNLKETGGTALGPALLLSTALASKIPGSQVIVCTDGRANVGLGSLETEDDYSICHHFYDQATNVAASRGVIVSVMSISDADCRLVQLGKTADKTAGKVNIVKDDEISKEIGSILSDDILATNVSIDLVTHRQLYFDEKNSPASCNIAQFIGNITNNSEITFRYGVRNDEDYASIPPPKDAPFQLKIIYRARDGGVYLRVITQIRPVTENRELAESEMDPAVIGTYATQSAAKLALEGDLENAREITDAHKGLLSRGMTLKSRYGSLQNEDIYESVQKRMNDIGNELQEADQEDESPASNPPPALPPRRSQSTSQLSMSSLESMLSKLPNIPKSSFKLKKRNKKKTAMQYKDKTAVKMFKFSKVTTSAFAS